MRYVKTSFQEMIQAALEPGDQIRIQVGTYFYVAAVGFDHDFAVYFSEDGFDATAFNGHKIREDAARILFPEMADLMWRA